MIKPRFLSISISILLLSIAISFNSCKKDISESDTSSALDNFTAEIETYRIEDFVNSAARDSGVLRVEEGAYTVLPGGAVVLIDLVSARKSITIIFDPNMNGGKGILCDDGKYRKGTILTTWDKSNGFNDSLRIASVTTSGYFVNNDQYDYAMTMTNNGRRNGYLSWDVSVTKANITFADGETIRYTSNRTSELTTSGPSFYINVYSVTGTADATGKNGKHFAAKITKPQIVTPACRWIKEGIVEITPDGGAVCTVDYGTGGCDGKATAEINGVITNLTL